MIHKYKKIKIAPVSTNEARVQQARQLTSVVHFYLHEQQLLHRICLCTVLTEKKKSNFKELLEKNRITEQSSEWRRGTLSSRISRRVASGIANEAVIFEHAQCIITTSYTKAAKKHQLTCILKENC